MGTLSGTRVLTVLLVGLIVVGGLPTITTGQAGDTTLAAEFSVSPERPNPFEPVKFDASRTTVGDDEFVQYKWSYETNEGIQTEYGKSFVHTFEADGSYEVKLTVEDSDGDIDTARQVVVLESDDPTADFETYPSSPGLNDRVTFDAEPSEAPDVEIVEYQWFINGEPRSGDQMLEVTFRDPDLYTIALKITDRAGKTDRISKTIPIGNKEAIYDNPAFDLVRSAPQRNVYVNPDKTVLFATKIESDGLPQATQVFSVDGSVVSRSDVSSANVQSTHEFTQLGSHTVEMKVEGVAGRTEQVQWDVTTHPFNSAPSFSEQSSETTLNVDGNTAVLTISVQNPESNTKKLNTEILTKLPDGLSVTGASDVSSGGAAIQTAATTVPPGRQASMGLEINVNEESLAGKRLIIPYQIRYHPQGNDDVIYTADEKEIKLLVTSSDTGSSSSADASSDTESSSSADAPSASNDTVDSSPGFSVRMILFSWFLTTVLLVRQTHSR